MKITNQMNIRLLITIIIVLKYSLCYSNEHVNDPLKENFYNLENSTPLERIEKSIEQGIKKIEEGVKNTRPLTDMQTKQAVLEAKQEYLEEGLLRNSSRIDEHAKLLKQVSMMLEGTTQAILGLKDRWNWWYTILSSILTGVAGASVTWFLKGRTNRNG